MIFSRASASNVKYILTYIIFNHNLGNSLGSVIALPLSGLLADTLGWEYVYYFFGSVAVFFSIVWSILAHDSPSKHPRISKVMKLFSKMFTIIHVKSTVFAFDTDFKHYTIIFYDMFQNILILLYL